MEHHSSKFTQGLNMPVLAIIAVVGTLVVWVTVVGVQAYYETGLHTEEVKKVIQPDYLALNKSLDDVHKQQLLAVDTDKIEPAKEAVIARYGRPAGHDSHDTHEATPTEHTAPAHH